MTDSEYIKTRKATADALINWARLSARGNRKVSNETPTVAPSLEPHL